MPFLYGQDGIEPSRYYSDYIDTYISRDITDMSQIHDMDRFMRFLRLLAGRTGQLVNASALAGDVGVSSTQLQSHSLSTYLPLLGKAMCSVSMRITRMLPLPL